MITRAPVVSDSNCTLSGDSYDAVGWIVRVFVALEIVRRTPPSSHPHTHFFVNRAKLPEKKGRGY